MELTKEQIEIVEHYLQNRKVEYLDLKVEILDHMILDIEQFMNKNHSFENALKMTTIKWEQHFKQRSSFYFGMFYAESKIVVDKAVKEFRPFYFLYLAAYLLPMFFLKNSAISFQEQEVNLINNLLLSATFLALIYMIYIIIKTQLSKQKSTYRFILKTQYIAVVFLIIPLLLGSFLDHKGQLSSIFMSFLSAGFMVTFICHHFYKKHQAVIEKYKRV
ncbi:hypothetical protein IU405_07100 [Polaribacter sp. BAL334]|uniref:hypothetical protein n=1 Tax=Polaribacter sp. BAL334 TaxID=1708178 RepID=UPI0018D20CF5|nr:hypothetical protein [Polaribacter sp. BAL334]MBG7612012.1 hypothetical protein [Polaribacter sp. BAL334]